jgi:hypothetical protein
MRMAIIPRDDELRPQAEQLITNVYARYYGANVTMFPDMLVSRLDADDGIECAAGLRFAADGFFSETYLNAPIEAMLSLLRRSYVNRESIFEVTSLASRAPHLVGSFLRKIIACGESAGFEWAFFTATAPLRMLLERMQLPLLLLAGADALRVESPDAWGSYYTHAPQVCAVHRDDVRACLGGRPGIAISGCEHATARAAAHG